jgi:hypothetical protein
MGKKVIIRSKTSGCEAAIDLWQSCILPACFGDYEVINQSEGECEVVILRWKE